MKKKIQVGFISLCSFLAIGIDSASYRELYEGSKFLINAGKECLNLGLLGSLLLFIGMLFIFSKLNRKSHVVINVLSILFSLLMIFGNSYLHYGNSSLVFGNIGYFILAVLMAIGYYFIFRLCLCYLFSYLDKKNFKESKNKVMKFFKEHPFIVSLILILLCWLPYIISFYPIILSPDPSYQIKQFFGIRTKYADYAILLDENVVLTNHHPVVHTLLIGGCLKLGTLINNDNLGLFLYSVIQITVLSCTLAYTIKYMIKNMNISNKFALIFLIFYSLVPMFPLYSMSGVKDVIFGSFVILYIVLLHKIISNNGEGFKLVDYIKMVLLMLLVILFRNNGLYVIVLSFPFLILAVKNNWKPFLIVFIVTIGCSMCYTKVILPAFKITPGSIRETLSIPFQQTARYVKYHSDDLSEKDIKIIDKVLGYEDIATRYDPELADPVKNNFNKYTTSEDLKEYFGVWFDGLLKHPMTYIDATVENIYGYFYPEKLDWYVYYKYDTRITKDGFDYHYNKLDDSRKVLSSFAIAFQEIPIIGLLSNIGFATWIVFILVGYVIYKKNYKRIILYLPALISILVCVASPANTYFRYALPYIFGLPIMIAFVLERQES